MSDFDPAEHEAEVIALMDGAVKAAAEFLNAATGGNEPVMVGTLWQRLVIREVAAMFSKDATIHDDQTAQEVNAALAACDVPYRLTKGVA